MKSTIFAFLGMALMVSTAAGQEKDLSLKPVPIAPKDDALLKLQKEKLNAVIEELNTVYKLHQLGKLTIVGPSSDGFGRFRDAVVDLNNPRLTMKTVNDFVALAEFAQNNAGSRLKAGTLAPEHYHHMRYHYFDALILQLRQSRQLEGK